MSLAPLKINGSFISVFTSANLAIVYSSNVMIPVMEKVYISAIWSDNASCCGTNPLGLYLGTTCFKSWPGFYNVCGFPQSSSKFQFFNTATSFRILFSLSFITRKLVCDTDSIINSTNSSECINVLLSHVWFSVFILNSEWFIV
jgi:hypothetical protein